MSLYLKPDQARRDGQQLCELVEQDRAKLDPRAKAGELQGLKSDVGRLTVIQTGTKTARVQKRAATRSQTEIAKNLATLLQAMRNLCRASNLSKELLTELGVGKAMRPGTVQTVLTGADMMVAAYARHTDVLREVGVLPADVEKVTTLRNQLEQVDGAQEIEKLTAKEKTALRNEVQARIEAAMTRIVAIAGVVFLDNPERLAMYEALVPSRGKKKPTAPAPVA